MLCESDIEEVERRADVITYTVLAEMDHFQCQRVQDFNRYMKHYITGQIEFYKQVFVYCMCSSFCGTPHLSH